MFLVCVSDQVSRLDEDPKEGRTKRSRAYGAPESGRRVSALVSGRAGTALFSGQPGHYLECLESDVSPHPSARLRRLY